MNECLLPVCEARAQFVIYVQSSFWFCSQHPNITHSSFSCSIFKLIFSTYLFNFLPVLPLSILATFLAVRVIRLMVRWSLHFVAFRLFFKAVIVTSVKSLGHFPFLYILLDQLCHYSEIIFSQLFEYIPRYIIIPCNHLFPSSLIACSTALCKV